MVKNMEFSRDNVLIYFLGLTIVFIGGIITGNVSSVFGGITTVFGSFICGYITRKEVYDEKN
jgi:hypothetical protein